MLDKKGNNILDREVNHKFGRGTQFYSNSVSIPTPVSTFPKSLREQGNNCSGYFLLKWGVVLPQFGEWTPNWKYSRVLSFGSKSCMIKTPVNAIDKPGYNN